MSTYPGLEQLVTAYLHQDADAIYGDPWGAIDAFAREDSRSVLVGAEVAEILEEAKTDDRIWEILDSFRMGIDPLTDGMTVREWLRLVAQRIGEATSGDDAAVDR